MKSHRMRQLERFLLACGATCCAVFLALLVEREWFQYRYARELSRARVLESAPSPSHQERPRPGEPLGMLEIPRLEISAVVVEGDDDRTLRRAVGHLGDSASPGEAGRVVLAGHRDTFFSNLRWVRKGDMVRMMTPRGSSVYEVKAVEIVKPGDTDAIGPSRSEMLTLVTCYPFDYVGPAPYRFLVHAVARDATSGLRRAAHRSSD